MNAQHIIDLLKLQKHPNEGGFFVETYRSDGSNHPVGYAGPRPVGTAIYYLVTPDSFSPMHRLPGDEIFHHYLGDAVEMLLLHPGGRSEVVVLGNGLAAGQRPQVVVPGGVWQGSKLAAGPRHGFALLGCTMAPGFDYADYAHGDRAELLAQYPDVAERILGLTPE